MPEPLIGVTASRTHNQTGQTSISVPETYIQALTQTGACPVVIPLGLMENALVPLLGRLDGVLFTGGGDIAPQHYQMDAHPKVSGVDPDRDRVEFLLLHRVVRQGLPFLGICRGFQVINVGLGGGLYADIADQHPNALKHDYYPVWPRDHLAHEVSVRSGSRLAQIVGEPLVRVNSLHHQGFDLSRLAPGLQAVGSAPDGVVEAFELPDHPFGLAVQWHPECLLGYAPMRALFQAFVTAGDHA